jgi:hypothetical protein
MLGKPATQMVRQSDDHGQQADSQGDNVARNRASDLDGGRFERAVFRIRLSDPHDRDQVVEWPLIRLVADRAISRTSPRSQRTRIGFLSRFAQSSASPFPVSMENRLSAGAALCIAGLAPKTEGPDLRRRFDPRARAVSCFVPTLSFTSVSIKPREIAVFSIRKGCGRLLGKSRPREPGLGTGRGGDVTGVANSLFRCRCRAISATLPLPQLHGARRARPKRSDRSATAA